MSFCIWKQFPNPVKYRAVVQAKVKMMRNLPLKHKENESDDKPIMQEKGILIFAHYCVLNQKKNVVCFCCVFIFFIHTFYVVLLMWLAYHTHTHTYTHICLCCWSNLPRKTKLISKKINKAHRNFCFKLLIVVMFYWSCFC